jgi:hypothetical protein
MTLNTAGKNAILDGGIAAITNLSLHTDAYAAGGGSSANEATGGSPAYARQAPSWAAASGGAAALSGTEVFNVPAGTYRRVGLWAGATYAGDADITDETFAGQGTYTVTAGTVTISG